MQKNCKIGIALVPLILAVIILFGICIGTLLITNKRNENNEMDVKQDEENKITDDNPLNDVRSDLQNEVRVGDYVKYIADNSDSVKWRVLEIDEKNSKINIIPTSALGNIQLKGQEDWLNAEEKINEECQKYTSESLEITKNDIRSLKIEDIELFIDSTEIENAKNMDDYGTIYIPSNQEGGMIAKYSSGENTFDGYNESIPLIKNQAIQVASTEWHIDNPTWNKIEGKDEDIGSIIGNSLSLLASRCVYAYYDYAGFSVYEVSSTKIQDYILHDFEGYEGNCSSGVRPLISLDMELLTGEGNGTENSPWELSK